MTDGSITRWIGLLKVGDGAAAQPLWKAYFCRMVGLARQRLRGAPCRAADEEDVALSAFDSFFAAAATGRFPQLADRRNLWPLLVSITTHKCVDLVRRESRRKRGGAAAPANVAFDDLIGHEPTPSFAAQLTEEVERLFVRLDCSGDPTLRPVARAKMEGDSTEAIAARLGCVRRTVERKLQIIARMWSDGQPP
jgi:DNA-directed RNA polymerase specialized sigma24 family protein